MRGAQSYDRIAGYFCGSVLEVAGEAIESVAGAVRVVCKSDLQAEDVSIARAAVQAQRQSWCASQPEGTVEGGGDAAKARFGRLATLLASDKLQVRVLPDAAFGLVHGKAGVVTLADGTRVAFS